MKGTSSWYHLLALLRSEYSIVSDFGTRGNPERVRETRSCLIEAGVLITELTSGRF